MFDLQEEYASLAQHLDIDWDALAGRHVLVTGATGLIFCDVFLLLFNCGKGYA